jgi:hypothetical protein
MTTKPRPIALWSSSSSNSMPLGVDLKTARRAAAGCVGSEVEVGSRLGTNQPTSRRRLCHSACSLEDQPKVLIEFGRDSFSSRFQDRRWHVVGSALEEIRPSDTIQLGCPCTPSTVHPATTHILLTRPFGVVLLG